MDEIIFILPPDKNLSIGGYKVVYEYANRLSERGWTVNIGYDCRRTGKRYNLPEFVRIVLARIVGEFRKFFYPRWFALSSKVKKLCIYTDDDFQKSDIMVATACGTASLVSKQDTGKKFYLIQGYEAWDGRTEDEVKATYRLGLKNIVIAKWLKDIVDESCGNTDSTLIPNGIDLHEYSLEVSPVERKIKKISMLLYLKISYNNIR